MSNPTHSVNIYKVTRQCGVRLRDLKRRNFASQKPKDCYAKATVRAIGRQYGEEHLRLVLRLIVETEGNANELNVDTLWAVSGVVASGRVEVNSDLFNAFDGIDLGDLRRWAKAVGGKVTASEVMMSVILWIVGGLQWNRDP